MTDVAEVYRRIWKWKPPRTCRAMHAAGLFEGRSPLDLGQFEIYDAETLADGDAFVSEQLVEGLVPIGGDRTGDRWCFATRQRIGPTTPVVHCPHDGDGATFVAPSFAGFIVRLLVEAADGKPVPKRSIARVERWLLPRWVHALREGITLEELKKDKAFARLPDEEFEHFR